MAKPVYVICCANIIEDKSKNLVSVFSIIERLMIERFVSSKPKSKSKKTNGSANAAQIDPSMIPELLQCVAVWMKSDRDSGQEYEHEWVIHYPNGKHNSAGGVRPFRFSEEAMKDLQRFRLGIAFTALPKGDMDGVCRIESRIRKQGNKRWQSQEFPLRFVLRTHKK